MGSKVSTIIMQPVSSIGSATARRSNARQPAQSTGPDCRPPRAQAVVSECCRVCADESGVSRSVS
jgi:hypothetical protein